MTARRLLALVAMLAVLAPAAASAAAPRAAKRAPRPVAAATAVDPWHAARALADAAEYDSALAVLRGALARERDDVGLRWLQAGITGEAGRHREAVALYERLAADHPERADELRGDLGAERLWADDPAGAVRDLRRWRALRPDDEPARRHLALALARADSLAGALAEYDALLRDAPGDHDLALERARVLGWMGRHGQAIAAYRALLARDSSDAEARLGLAMNENWQGGHRRAARRLEPLAADPRVADDALEALASARYWDGDPDGALAALAARRRHASDDRDTRELAGRIARERAPRLRIEGGRADDSDGLRVRSSGMTLTWPLARGVAGLAGWQRDNVMDDGGTADPLRLSAGLRARLDRAWSAYGTFTHTDWGDGPGVRPGGEGGLVCRPVDGVRLEAVASREPVLTRRSLALGITMLAWTGALDLAPTERLGLHALGREQVYSDSNRAERVALSARLRVAAVKRGELALTLGSETLHTRTDPDHGYYAPDFHREWGPGAEAEWRPAPEWTLGASGQLGRQQDKGDEATSFYAVSARVEATFARAYTVALEGGRGDSSLQSEGGYRRAWWQAALERSF